MEQHMIDLINRADMGDLESQYKLGRAYKFAEDGFSKDLLESHKWLKLAAEGDHPDAQLTYAYFFIDIGDQSHIKHDLDEGTYWLKRSGANGNAQALWLLIGVYANFAPETSSDAVIDCFKILIGTCNDYTAAVELGAIYCGSPTNKHVRRFPGLKSYCEPEKGFRLMEESIRMAEGMDASPLKYEQYAMACQAYDFDSSKAYKPETEGSCYFKGSDKIIALAKKLCYAEKALAALQNNEYTSPFPKEVVTNLIAEQKNFLASAKGELLELLNKR